VGAARRYSAAECAVAITLIVLALGLIGVGARVSLYAVSQGTAGPDDAADASGNLQSWTGLAPVGSLALTELVRRQEAQWRGGRLDAGVLEANLERLLSVRPAYGPGWIALANLRLARGASMERVIAAADMSSWVAPRESAVMLARVDLGLRIWEELDAARRISLVHDLVAIGPMLSETEMARLRPLLLTRVPEEIEELSGMVRARGGGGLPGWAEWLGLKGGGQNSRP
jgi:hypothetical protein